MALRSWVVFSFLLIWVLCFRGSGKLPGVLVHHAFQGVTDYEIGRAEQIAKVCNQLNLIKNGVKSILLSWDMWPSQLMSTAKERSERRRKNRSQFSPNWENSGTLWEQVLDTFKKFFFFRITTLKWRLEAAVENIKKQDRVDPNRIAAIGYCFVSNALFQILAFYSGWNVLHRHRQIQYSWCPMRRLLPRHSATTTRYSSRSH